MTKENNNQHKDQGGDDAQQQSQQQERQKNKNEFFAMLEDKAFSFGKKILKNGVTNIAMAQIHNTEEKIKSELEHKYKEYQAKALQGVMLLLGVVFLVYGFLSLLFMELSLSEWTNVIFGAIFFGAYIIMKHKK